jgi:hypothetical protein
MKRAHGIVAFLVLILALGFAGCSPRSRPDLGVALVGSWTFEDRGMRWQWNFDRDGSFAWAILGQSDMGGRPVDVRGSGSYALEGGRLLLRFRPFEGIPGIYAAQPAAPGFDAKTAVVLGFAGRTAMTWSFDSAALGPQRLALAKAD